MECQALGGTRSLNQWELASATGELRAQAVRGQGKETEVPRCASQTCSIQGGWTEAQKRVEALRGKPRSSLVGRVGIRRCPDSWTSVYQVKR